MRRFVSGLGAAAVVVGGLAALPGTASAAPTITVRPGQSIQAAVDRAAPGTRIVILPGTFHESVDITKDGITIQGSGTATRVVPPKKPKSSLCGDPTGICIVGRVNPKTGAIIKRINNVTISNVWVSGFTNGVFAFGARNLHYVNISASDNEEYGIARFDSLGGEVITNRTWGSAVAGVYIGDSSPANVFAAGNQSWNNGYGIFVRHVRGAQVAYNTVWGNCQGILVLNDGQKGGNGNNAFFSNTVRQNNKVCPADEGAPPLSGGGILLVGTDHVTVTGNAINGNRGRDVNSGGLVLVGKGVIPGVPPVTDTLARNNTLFNNSPGDIRVLGRGSGNRFLGNRCRTSIPTGFCSVG